MSCNKAIYSWRTFFFLPSSFVHYVHWREGKRSCWWPYSRLNIIILSAYICSSRFGNLVSRFTEDGDRDKLPIIGLLTNSLRKTWEIFQGISCHCCFFAIPSLPKVIVVFDHSLKKLFSQGHKPTRMIQYDVDLLRSQTQLLQFFVTL